MIIGPVLQLLFVTAFMLIGIAMVARGPAGAKKMSKFLLWVVMRTFAAVLRGIGNIFHTLARMISGKKGGNHHP